ncbi:MAG: hypothetical protein Q9194_004326 [Teloschistes cf. exilis]
MRLFTKLAQAEEGGISSTKGDDIKPPVIHDQGLPPQKAGWQVSRAGDGDTAMAIFSTPDEVHEPIDPDEARRLERKIDFMILPYLAVCYAFFYIDKTTLSYAAIFGIQEDLNLAGTEYNWLSSIFYFGFLIWAFPTNFLMQRLPIGKYLGFNIFMWGFFLMLQAACQSFATLALLRAFGGAAEACSDPSFMLITSMWYTRKQQPVRIGIWYTANGLGIAGGGLLGYGIGNIKGALPSWKYEFIIIGALCCIWGIVVFIMLPDSPVTAKLLTHRQRRLAIERLRENQTGVENKHLKAYQVREAFMDYKLYFFFVLGIVGNIPNGGISNFGHTKKVVTNAVLFLGYCTGNIAGPFFYKTSQSPTYSLGIWSMIVSHLVEVVVILLLWFLLSNENKRRDRIQSDEIGGLEGRDLDATAFSDMTDRENLK